MRKDGIQRLREAVAEIAARHPALELLLLHGSQAAGSAHPGSDWDFAFRATGGIEADSLIADLAKILRADRVDLADLDRASALLRYRAARDGLCLYERRPGAFARFWLDAVRFWCEAAPVLERGYADVLDRLGP